MLRDARIPKHHKNRSDHERQPGATARSDSQERQPGATARSDSQERHSDSLPNPTGEDVTTENKTGDELRRLNRALRAISSCNHALLHAEDEAELLREICRIVVETGGYRMAWVGYRRDDPEKSVEPVAEAGFEAGYLDTLDVSWADVERGRGPTGVAIRTAEVCTTNDMQGDPRFRPWRREAERRGYSSAQGLPLKSDGGTFGALTIYSERPFAFNAQETALLMSLADNLAYGITMLRTRTAAREAGEELRQSEARYRSLFENRRAAMLIISPEDGRIVDANPAAVDFYGWSRRELCMMLISDINTLSREEILAEMQLASSLKRTYFNFRHRLADGSVREVEVFSAPISIQGREMLYSIINDITERRREENARQELEQRLVKAQRLEAIGTMAGGIAHDFNNLLTPILGYAEMGETEENAPRRLAGYFSEIRKAAERAKDLVSQILTFSRTEGGPSSPVSIQEVVQEALRLLRPSIPEAVSVRLEIDPACRSVMADTTKLHQVILNLCTNAFHAMEETGGTLTIGLREAEHSGSPGKVPTGASAELSIADTGTGMDETTLERIFEPFFTTKPVNRGTGLGLSVVHGIIAALDGEIQVESRPGEGTLFRIFLPLVDGRSAAPAPPGKATEKGDAAILYVDDEPASLRMMEIMLDRLGYRATALSSPEEAVRVFQPNPGEFDLLLTDLSMPAMTGIELAARLHEIRPSLPVVLMTGYGKEIGHARPISEYGITRLLKKPVKFAALAEALRAALKKP
ncbi:ATP-binding protein [Chlorobium sp. N1]|uniref:hybrid sensor histidine kinase/response regulator n=1 Tax=Chlorobium sp. N1 TaxID=2491138 RepID=UPI00103D2F59|nr:ATP-binding protein [Chlorobium sp. N1]TCD47240.1 PAS domain S-box protein [Chlorobium sp. N1]